MAWQSTISASFEVSGTPYGPYTVPLDNSGSNYGDWILGTDGSGYFIEVVALHLGGGTYQVTATLKHDFDILFNDSGNASGTYPGGPITDSLTTIIDFPDYGYVTWSPPALNHVHLGAGGSVIVASTETGVYISSDLGDTWDVKHPEGGTSEYSKAICSGTGTYIIAELTSGGTLYRSDDSGSSWGIITPAGGDTFSVNAMAISESGQYVIIVGANSTTPIESCYISTDYGATWTAYTPAPTAKTWTGCDISDDGQVIGVSKTGDVYMSFDGGSTWARQAIPGTHEVWINLAISGDGKVGIVSNIGDSNEFFINSGYFDETTVSSTALTSFARTLIDDSTASDARDTLELGTGDSPEFTGLTLSGLIATRLTYSDGSSQLASVSDLTSWIAGTNNEIAFSDDGDGSGTIALAAIIDLGSSS